MQTKTKIEWTETTWNPIIGCSPVSEGCRNCWAARLSSRGMCAAHRGLTKGGKWTGEVRCLPDRLDEPSHWKKSRMIAVGLMGDLFHEKVPTSFIMDVFGVMANNVQHTFQILTKRPERMMRLLKRPIVNVWLGVSVENQKAADERISLLLQTPAAVRFVSAEPILGPVIFNPWIRHLQLTGDRTDNFGIDWIIAGGESGPGSRPMNPDWARSIRDQCRAAGVPFFFKQQGDWVTGLEPHKMTRVGKNKAGRLLDGRTWDEFPAPF